MEKQAKSPLPKAKAKEIKKMSFPEAIQAVIEGKKVTKLEWDNSNIYLLLKDGYLRIHTLKGDFDVLAVSEGDLIGKDYVELAVLEVVKAN